MTTLAVATFVSGAGGMRGTLSAGMVFSSTAASVRDGGGWLDTEVVVSEAGIVAGFGASVAGFFSSAKNL